MGRSRKPVVASGSPKGCRLTTHRSGLLRIAGAQNSMPIMPHDYLAKILSTGMIGELQINELEHGYAATAWQRYMEFEQSMMGMGNLGEQSPDRAMLAD